MLLVISLVKCRNMTGNFLVRMFQFWLLTCSNKIKPKILQIIFTLYVHQNVLSWSILDRILKFWEKFNTNSNLTWIPPTLSMNVYLIINNQAILVHLNIRDTLREVKKVSRYHIFAFKSLILMLMKVKSYDWDSK